MHVRYESLLYFPTQIRLPIGGERVTCRGSKLTNSLGRTKLTNSLGTFDFFAVFSSFELGDVTKHLTTGPAGNDLNVSLGFASGNIEGLGEAKLTVSLEASH